MNKISWAGIFLVVVSFVMAFLWADGSSYPSRYLLCSLIAMNGALWIVNDAKGRKHDG